MSGLDPGVGANRAFGHQVRRAAADVFDGTTTSLFTVSGGRVYLTHLEGEVSAFAVDNTASLVRLASNPTVGSVLDLCANLDVDSHIVGALYTITGVLANVLQGGVGGGSVGMHTGIVIPEGTIDLINDVDAGTGGALIAWELWWQPLDVGAEVVPA